MALVMMSLARPMMGAGSSCGSMPAVSVRVSSQGGRRVTLWDASLTLTTRPLSSLSMVHN